MIQKITSFCLLFLLVLGASDAFATQYKKKKRKSRSARSSRVYKTSKHARRSRHTVHHGTGPDLKTMTTNSPYTEDPNNGVTAVETKGPGL